jgi:hypothetical protein
MEDLHKELKVALQEMLDVWLDTQAPCISGEAVEVAESVVA